jgi:translation initiation factor IF-3
MIRISPVRVVDENGAQLGVMPTVQARTIAQERGFDLVEVAPMASPPVVKFLDFGQYKYELAKREKEAKRRARSVQKEIRLRPKIGSGDFDTKVHRAIEFLEDGDRIKVSVLFRGRELTHPEIGQNLLIRFAAAIGENGVVERTPQQEGRSMFITVASTHKPKPREGSTPAKGHHKGHDGAAQRQTEAGDGEPEQSARAADRSPTVTAEQATAEPVSPPADSMPTMGATTATATEGE